MSRGKLGPHIAGSPVYGEAIRPLDTLLAIKAISLEPNLLENDRRVACVLIEHFNRYTGRCDPSLSRIAKLLGICERTVIRAIKRLEAAGLVRKIRHGGWHSTNHYAPNWTRIAELNRAWRQRFDWASMPPSDVSPRLRQASHMAGDTPVTQTDSINLLHERGSRGQPKRARPNGLSPSSAQAAHAAAERRWLRKLQLLFVHTPDTYAEVIGCIDPAMQEAATQAELKRPGAGLRFILEELRLHSLGPDAEEQSSGGEAA